MSTLANIQKRDILYLLASYSPLVSFNTFFSNCSYHCRLEVFILNEFWKCIICSLKEVCCSTLCTSQCNLSVLDSWIPLNDIVYSLYGVTTIFLPLINTINFIMKPFLLVVQNVFSHCPRWNPFNLRIPRTAWNRTPPDTPHRILERVRWDHAFCCHGNSFIMLCQDQLLFSDETF